MNGCEKEESMAEKRSTLQTGAAARGDSTTRIIVVRHGESLANAKRIYLGHIDWDLSERGHFQARRAALALAEEKIDAVYSSDLLRAYNTALPHAELRGLPVIKSEELRELYIGDWEGVLVERLETEWREEFEHGWRENFGTFTPPGGESIPAARERMYNAVLKIARENLGKTVLIATHAAAIRAMWGKIAGIAPERMGSDSTFPTNASVSRILFDGERLLPIEYSNDEHLREEK